MFFHNDKVYDSHFIINEIANVEKIKDIDMITKTEEKYISYSFNNLRCLDSLAFMCPDDSLEKLVERLKNKINMMYQSSNTHKHISRNCTRI